MDSAYATSTNPSSENSQRRGPAEVGDPRMRLQQNRLHRPHVVAARQNVDDVSAVAGAHAQDLNGASPMIEIFPQPRLDPA
jgi:hypothetical protein